VTLTLAFFISSLFIQSLPVGQLVRKGRKIINSPTTKKTPAENENDYLLDNKKVGFFTAKGRFITKK
jgi:hypothetical protein